VILPSIFLLVAALVLNILMTRLADRQRVVIGTLKALGYSDRQVFAHFLSFGSVVGLAGAGVGIGLGILLAMGMIHMYRSFFEFPTFQYHVYPDLLGIGIAISLGFALAGTAKGVWAVLRLEPAEAMRPRPPERGGAIFLERIPAVWRRMGFRTHIALRSMIRNRFRTGTGVFTSALAVAIMVTGLALYDSMELLVDFQFEQIAHSDVDIGMRDEKSTAALLEGRGLPGVDYAEPILGLVCDVRHGRHARRLSILGLTAEHKLTTPRRADGQPIEIPPAGLVASRKLAEVLGADVGDTLELTPVRGRRRTVRAPLAAVVEGFIGLECYADLNYLSRLVGEGSAVNAIQLSVDHTRIDGLYRAVKQLPNAQGVSARADTKANIESTFVNTMSTTLTFMVLFAGVIALGSLLNTSFIEIADRTRDIATFRVLGYRAGQVAGIFFRQNLVVFLIGLGAGLPLGYGMVVGMAKAYDTELFRMPVIFQPQTIVLACLISFVFVLIAQWFVYRQIVRLDWLEGVQTKE
jgi:putative ABC transport system permease protein